MITPAQVQDTLRRHLLVDGYDFVLDLDASRGSTLVDARTGTPPGPASTRRALAFPLAVNEAANRAAEDAALHQARDAFAAAPHDIACVLVEPIQGEGGDRHLSARFLQELQALAHANDALFVCDEVQTGVGLTGTPWAYQQLGLTPDVVAFGKKTHVCGIMAGGRLDEVPDHVFATSSRLNSTFGGGLVDLVRATIMLDVIERDGLIERAAKLGEVLLAGSSDSSSATRWSAASVAAA
ncbi:hypothetical protein GCM10011354_10780 [Egicoccus halophilus]|uniref:Aminotransferase class-III n=1 Tax=Egicoccus halophilus TaxID=1670830 RepID=A0A8J3AC61_9ACTN|nr:hypothetical protein GCM10011354_10780 [Egicoccus halophilus]